MTKNLYSRLYVGHINEKSKPDDLQQLFSQYGQIVQFHYIEGKDHAYITYQSAKCASITINNLNGKQYLGQNLLVEYSDRSLNRKLNIKGSKQAAFKQGRCFKCNRKGHIARDCSESESSDQSDDSSSSSSSSSSSESSSSSSSDSSSESDRSRNRKSKKRGKNIKKQKRVRKSKTK